MSLNCDHWEIGHLGLVIFQKHLFGSHETIITFNHWIFPFPLHNRRETSRNETCFTAGECMAEANFILWTGIIWDVACRNMSTFDKSSVWSGLIDLLYDVDGWTINAMLSIAREAQDQVFIGTSCFKIYLKMTSLWLEGVAQGVICHDLVNGRAAGLPGIPSIRIILRKVKQKKKKKKKKQTELFSCETWLHDKNCD